METAISLNKKARGAGHPHQQPNSPHHGPLTPDSLVAIKEENILTSASGVQKPERFDLYVGKLRSICGMHGIPIGSSDNLSGFLNRLEDDRRFGMDFWAFVGKLSSREGGELNDDQTLAVVIAGITNQMPDENDDRLRPQINHLRALLSGVDIQRPESQLPDPQRPDAQHSNSQQPAPARAPAAVPIDHRRRRFSITPEDAPPTLEMQMLETIQRLELINRQLKESLVSIDQRINHLEGRLGEYPADSRFSDEPPPPVAKEPPPVAPPPFVTRRVQAPPVVTPPVAPPPAIGLRIDEVPQPAAEPVHRVEQATPLATPGATPGIDQQSLSPAAKAPPPIEQQTRVSEPANPSTEEQIPETIQEPIQEPIRHPIEQINLHEQHPLRESALPPQEQSTPLVVEPVEPLLPEPHHPEPHFAPAEQAALSAEQTALSIDKQDTPPAARATASIKQPTLRAAARATLEEQLTLHPTPLAPGETSTIPETPVRETPVREIQKTQAPPAQAPKTQAPKTQAKPPGTTSKQRLVLDPIAPPASSAQSSSARKISKVHTRPLFAGYESAPSSSGKKVAAGVAIAFLLAGSGYAWHRYSTLIAQLVHPGETASSTTQNPSQPADATPEDSSGQTAQPQSQTPRPESGPPQTEQPQSSQPQSSQPQPDRPSDTAANPQPETSAEPQPHKPALDRPASKAAAAADDLFSNSNWSAIKVPSEVMQKNLIVSRVPTYPEAAKASRVKGSVIVEALIQKDGSVGRVRVLQGDSRLRTAAMDAIFRQKYRPYTVNGTPVDVITTVSLDFTPPQ